MEDGRNWEREGLPSCLWDNLCHWVNPFFQLYGVWHYHGSHVASKSLWKQGSWKANAAAAPTTSKGDWLSGTPISLVYFLSVDSPADQKTLSISYPIHNFLLFNKSIEFNNHIHKRHWFMTIIWSGKYLLRSEKGTNRCSLNLFLAHTITKYP